MFANHLEQHTNSTVRRVLTAAALFTAAAAAQPAGAQTSGIGLELRPSVGAYIPTGDQRDFVKDAVLVGGEASWRVIAALALTGTFAWSPTKARLTAREP